MKKNLALLMLAAAPSLWAADNEYPYLIFTSQTGTKTAVAVADLEITFAEGRLLAKNSDGTTTLTLSELASMAFGKDATDAVKTAEASMVGSVEVFTSTGIRIGNYASIGDASKKLQRGIYLAKQNGRTSKICVK